VGIIGFGKVGAYLVQKILEHESGPNPFMRLAFVCDVFAPDNVLHSSLIPDRCKAKTLDGFFDAFGADLVVEVAHPDIPKRFGAVILQTSDFVIASTTAFADAETEQTLRTASEKSPKSRGIYLTVGALYGAQDIKKMSDGGQLRKLQITMVKHPLSLYPEKDTPEHDLNEQAKRQDAPVVLYRGPIRGVARVFPRNVNTLCTAALAAVKTTGMDGTVGVLIADRRMQDMVIETVAEGPPKSAAVPGLRVRVTRENPSEPGEVTGMATFHSFYSSLMRVAATPAAGPGIHLA
jgi:predicted dinucleotide-utilizing enzyme